MEVMSDDEKLFWDRVFELTFCTGREVVVAAKNADDALAARRAAGKSDQAG